MSAVYPEPTVLAGDWKDDDGQVLDDLVQPQGNPLPVPIEVMVTPVTERPARTTRLMSGALTLDPTWRPTQILPADPNRKRLIIWNNSTDGDGLLWITDDPSKIPPDTDANAIQSIPGTAAVAGYLPPSVFPLYLDEHTGPVVVSAVGGIVSLPITWWAVTE
jgi:hypothetical protein